MTIKKNPFSAGSRDCAYCRVEFLWRGTDETWQRDDRCENCTDHTDSNPESELKMLREHQGRLVGAVHHARELARRTKREDKNAREELADRRRQTAAASPAGTNTVRSSTPCGRSIR